MVTKILSQESNNGQFGIVIRNGIWMVVGGWKEVPYEICYLGNQMLPYSN